MRVLVTGGAGFIGSNFVRQALSGAYRSLATAEFVVLDKLTYAGTRESLAPVAGDPRLTFVHGDVCDADLVGGLMKDVSLVVHCAAETHVDRSIHDPSAFVRTNVLGTHVLLEAGLRAGVDKIVLVSTDEVYGSIDSGSWNEQEPLRPSSPYSASKAAGDMLALAAFHTHGLPVCVTRCSNNYGPYQFPEKLIPLFITGLLDGEELPVYGDGLNVREWTHVDDHCRGVALVAEQGRPGEVYNIGSGVELTNIETTRHLLEISGADWSVIRFVDDRKGHDRRYSLDSTKIATQLGYRPEVPFLEGLRRTARWYAEHRSWWEPLKREMYEPVGS
ncbi:dTDP-glucose 4,6-dehydratase [Nonomuraea sp. SYSU D8015]|uniref:dTDP-glucose 4,6-dehydratase n=1 Tax=Nonomuraea sp. SYSU D8015 TaxID=2593644 RepID=UPI0016615522|nr:dTDP-glucose 4,6-dehydratase [Nonomuraea sp. SYSU D8015]